MLGSIMSGAASMFDSATNMASGAYNIFNSEYNKKEQTAAKNWAFADSRAANDMMRYYMQHGNLNGYQGNINQDYNDVADYFNPFMSISSLDLQKNAQKLSEDQFKFSQDIAKNGTQYKVADLKKAGLSPLMALGDSSSFSPTGIAGGSNTSSVQKNRPAFNNIAALDFGTSLAYSINQIRLTNAQIGNIEADTKLKEAQSGTELVRPDLLKTEISKNKADTDKIKEDTNFIKEQIKQSGLTQSLTENQIAKVSMEYAALSHDIEIAIKNGTPVGDSIPYLVKQVQTIVSSMGIDLNSTEGSILQNIGIAIGTAAAAYLTFKKPSKGSPKIEKPKKELSDKELLKEVNKK